MELRKLTYLTFVKNHEVELRKASL